MEADRQASVREDPVAVDQARLARGASLLRGVGQKAYVWVPLLVLCVLASPSVTFMLPACQDYLDEIYQPLQALKFFKTGGQAFHKYGPLPNFLLAPGYGASTAWWHLSGSFERPSEEFPYGFKHPFEQIGFLILQGRVLFLVLGLVCFGYLAHTLRLVTPSRWAALLAVMFCLATNYAVAHCLASPKPDSPMLAFSAAAMAVYIRIVCLGLTVRRGMALSILAVCAISSKELAGPMWVLPYLAVAWSSFRGSQGQSRKAFGISVATGVISYALLNIVYAPGTWLARMKFWLAGPGIDSAVWGGGLGQQIAGALRAMANNLGPAGTVVVIAAVVAFAIWYGGKGLKLALPAISVAALGVGKILYTEDRFYMIVCLALVPVVAGGLGVVLERLRWAPMRAALVCILCLAAAVNVWFATYTWLYLDSTFERVVERHVLAHASKMDSIHLLSTFKRNPGSSRLEWLGYRVDARAIQEIAARRTDLPGRIYTLKSHLQFIEECAHRPARAKMMKDESGFDFSRWGGLEGLGYRLAETIEPRAPGWFPFGWMPALSDWKFRRTVVVYERL